MSKTEFYADLNRDFQALMAGETSFLAMIANTSALLFERLGEVNWAGFYLLEGDTLVLGPFQGQTGLRPDPGWARRMRRGGGASPGAARRGRPRL
ncbi:Free methionine-R-sulfoxide reductase [Klebsiella quasipneumoniae]|nr:Free methionine-R-sulfoxide reductase [Klebsiella quasipneumoniae]